MTTRVQTKMPSWSIPQTLPLENCAGSLSFEGFRRPCFDGCAAHFDACADAQSEYGDSSEAYSPYPNSVLAWVGHLPTSRPVMDWKSKQSDSDRHLTQTVVLLEVRDLFCDQTEADVDGWVVLRTAPRSAELTAHLCLTARDGADVFTAALNELTAS